MKPFHQYLNRREIGGKEPSGRLSPTRTFRSDRPPADRERGVGIRPVISTLYVQQRRRTPSGLLSQRLFGCPLDRALVPALAF
jgi:hypothetical protein